MTKKAKPENKAWVKDAQPKDQAPTGRTIQARGNAPGNAAPEAQSPEPERSGDRSPKGDRTAVSEVNQRAGQQPVISHSPALRPLSAFLRESLRNGHSATASSDPNGIRTLTLTSVTVGDFSERNTKITSADAHRVKDLWLEPGDILIQRSNAPELVGTSRLYRGERNYAIFPDLMIRVRLNDEADPRFIELVLQSEPLRQYFKGRAKGMSGSMPKIDQETISEAPIPHFHIDDQRRIVAEIEKQFTRLEAGVAALRRVQANLKRYRAAVLKAACEGRLVPTEAELARSPRSTKNGPPAYETGAALLARILSARRQNWQGRGKYKEPDAPDSSALPAVPEGWAWCRLEQLCTVVGGLTKNPKRAQLPNQLPYLRVANVYANALRLDNIENIGVSESELPKLLVEKGDLLIVEGNGSKDQIGRLAAWDGSIESCVHQNHLIKARPVDVALSKWLLHWLLSPNGRHFIELVASSTSGLYTLSTGKVGDLMVALPPLAEQTRIVTEVERRLSVVEELEAVVSTNLQRAARLRQSILQKAFTGEL